MLVGCPVSELELAMVAFYCSPSWVVFLGMGASLVCAGLPWWLVGCGVLLSLLVGLSVKVVVEFVFIAGSLSLYGRDTLFLGG